MNIRAVVVGSFALLRAAAIATAAPENTIPSHVLSALPPGGLRANGANGAGLGIASWTVMRFHPPGLDGGVLAGLISNTAAGAALQ